MAEQFANTQHNDERTLDLDEFSFINDDSDIEGLIHNLMQDPNENILLGTNQTNTSGINSGVNNGNSNVRSQNSAFGNPIRVPVWPVPPSSYNCSCCQTLREYLHINGTWIQRLVIHGRLGIITHVVLERYNDGSSEEREYHMFDFCQESINSVKQFLVQYCEERKREGFIMLQDPLSYFYDALFVGLGSDGAPVTDVSSHPQTAKGNDTQMHREENSNNPKKDRNGSRVSKRNMASQRAKAKEMTVKDLADYFHLTETEASKKLNMCETTIKKNCREGGLLKWPSRQIKAARSGIEKMKKLLKSNDPDKRALASRMIKVHEQSLASIYELVDG